MWYKIRLILLFILIYILLVWFNSVITSYAFAWGVNNSEMPGNATYSVIQPIQSRFYYAITSGVYLSILLVGVWYVMRCTCLRERDE